MPFTPGQLTASQAAALNKLEQDVRALMAMTAQPPLTIHRSAGCVSLAIGSSEDEFDAMVIDRRGLFSNALEIPGITSYSWVRMKQYETGNNDPFGSPIVVQNPDWSQMGTFNLKRNRDNVQPWPNGAYGARAIDIGQVVRIKPSTAGDGWYTTDSVGGIGWLAILYKDHSNTNQTFVFSARDLVAGGGWASSPPIAPPPGTTVPPAPSSSGGGI